MYSEKYSASAQRVLADSYQEHTFPRRPFQGAHRSWEHSPRNGLLSGTFPREQCAPRNILLGTIS